MRRTLVAALLPLALASTAQADSLDLKLNDSMAELIYATGAQNLGLQDGDVSVGFLFNEDNDLAATLGFQSTGRMDDALSFAIGLKSWGVHVDEAEETLLSFGLGAGIGYTIPGTPVTLSASGYVAPNILTFGDSSGVREWSVRAQAQVLPNAALFVGWRELRVRLDDYGSYELDDTVHIGLRLGF